MAEFLENGKFNLVCVPISVLQKCLTTLDLTSLGVGSCVGTGMYLVAGMVARSVAGPGVVISFIIAAIASIFSGSEIEIIGVVDVVKQKWFPGYQNH
ncbi:hypothetical protein K0M31_008128 [Melipona bicolor]|uniref:Uncharacterized protein n=1 Tax=Melipona bicolor TaxID=60889 RepID=A0AA40FR69_9HYME|nr:hypothetical protein K0M31_008128 [Melipona bicolor]